MTSNPHTPDPIPLSVRLSWLAVESSGRKPDFNKRDSNRRFTFSDRDPVLYEQMLISLRQLQQVACQLLLTPQKPLLTWQMSCSTGRTGPPCWLPYHQWF
jgi:hypothetical protein